MKSLLLASACLPEAFPRYSQRMIAKVCVITDWMDQILPFSLLFYFMTSLYFSPVLSTSLRGTPYSRFIVYQIILPYSIYPLTLQSIGFGDLVLNLIIIGFIL